MELFSSRYTFSESPLKAHSLSASFSYEEILEVLAPYLTESERQMSENLKNMKEMLSMVQLFQDFSPDLEIGDSEIILKMNLKTGSEMDLKMNLQTNLKTSSEMNLQIRLHRNHPLKTPGTLLSVFL